MINNQYRQTSNQTLSNQTYFWIRIRKVAVLPGTARRRLRRLEELSVGAVDGEGERALGELVARLVKDQAVGTRLVDDLNGYFSFLEFRMLKMSISELRTTPSLHS